MNAANTPFEPVLRWQQCPPICIAENLPAFNSPEALNKFLDTCAPRVKIKRIWQCDACKLFHATTSAPSPSGASSGTERK